jgi:hypothetical protein
MKQIYLQEDMQHLNKNPFYLFKLLQKETGHKYQHKLDYIVKYNNGNYKIKSSKQDIFQEISDTYSEIFNNTTELMPETQQQWFTNLPSIDTQEQKYLSSPFSAAEMITAIKEQDPYSAGGPDNITAKMLQVITQNNNEVTNKLLDLYNTIKTVNYIPSGWKNSTTCSITDA